MEITIIDRLLDHITGVNSETWELQVDSSDTIDLLLNPLFETEYKVTLGKFAEQRRYIMYKLLSKMAGWLSKAFSTNTFSVEQNYDQYIMIGSSDNISNRLGFRCILRKRFADSYLKGVRFTAVTMTDFSLHGCKLVFGKTTNLLRISRSRRIVTISCIHSVVKNTTIHDALNNLPTPTNMDEPAELLPHEHFNALCTFVGGMAELSLEQVLSSTDPLHDFGITDFTFRHLTRAMLDLYPEYHVELLKQVVEQYKGETDEWLDRHTELIISKYAPSYEGSETEHKIDEVIFSVFPVYCVHTDTNEITYLRFEDARNICTIACPDAYMCKFTIRKTRVCPTFAQLAHKYNR